MARLLTGSINMTKLSAQFKQQNKAFNKSTSGDVWAYVNIYVNDEEDNYGNVASIKLNHKDNTKEENVYFGNLKDVKNKVLHQ